MIWAVHPGSRIRMLTFSHPGSRIQGAKRHQIPDPDPQHCKGGEKRRPLMLVVSIEDGGFFPILLSEKPPFGRDPDSARIRIQQKSLQSLDLVPDIE